MEGWLSGFTQPARLPRRSSPSKAHFRHFWGVLSGMADSAPLLFATPDPPLLGFLRTRDQSHTSIPGAATPLRHSRPNPKGPLFQLESPAIEAKKRWKLSFDQHLHMPLYHPLPSYQRGSTGSTGSKKRSPPDPTPCYRPVKALLREEDRLRQKVRHRDHLHGEAPDVKLGRWSNP